MYVESYVYLKLYIYIEQPFRNILKFHFFAFIQLMKKKKITILTCFQCTVSKDILFYLVTNAFNYRNMYKREMKILIQLVGFFMLTAIMLHIIILVEDADKLV